MKNFNNNKIKNIHNLRENLEQNFENILNSYKYIDRELRWKREAIPAAEWFLDNLYLVEKEYKYVKHNLGRGSYSHLPTIKDTDDKKYVRIYSIAEEILSINDGRIDEEIIQNFVSEYQKTSILDIQELWLLPIMLRVSIINRISFIAVQLKHGLEEKQVGESIGDRIIFAIHNNTLEDEIYKLEKEEVTFTSHSIEKLIRILKDNSIENPSVFSFIDKELKHQKTTTEEMIKNEHQKQSFFQLYIGNYITSIRALDAINFAEVFENLCCVEKILSEDPAKVFLNMDFKSRDYYRQRVCKLAKSFNTSEVSIAKTALNCALETKEEEPYFKHIGYYILDDGVSILKQKLNVEETSFLKFKNLLEKHKVNYYIGSIIVFTILLMGIFLWSFNFKNIYLAPWQYIVMTLAIIIPSSEVVISILNWSINHLIPPRFVPKIEYKHGIPEELSTMIVIPTIINNEKRALDLIDDLEVYYLANKEKNLFFGILADFKDSSSEKEEKDEIINATALKRIKELNKKYSKNGEDIFYFFNRYRQFNEKENSWLGFERKRGKLMEFNDLLRGDKNTSYNVISGDISKLYKIKYIITLDADTELPRGSASKLVGAMSHILNIPYVNRDSKKVLRGFGLMQPRVTVSTINANKTIFSRVFSGETGIDTYSTAVSDIYQDLFGEGIFTGKGIYDVDMFNLLLKDEIPQNAVLSHDLLEGSYVRTALVTDLELVDGYPAYYMSASKRLHRWVRGDWQLIPWLFKPSPLNTLSKWKILDNLRRSLLTPSIIILIILSLSLINFSDKGLLLAFLALISPILFDVSENVVSPIRGISLSGKIKNAKMVIEQVFLIICFLPFTAYNMLNAIFKTIYRIKVSKRHLLEWQTAADVERNSGKSLNSYITYMWPGSFIAFIICLLSFNNSLSLGLFMLPSCFLWFISPYIAYSISREIKDKKHVLNEDEINELRLISRRTWAYFDDFVNEDENWLAPDNYQEEPHNGVAHRTSPTNIGMGLTSNIAAYDLGYIGILEFLERTENILESINTLPKHKGHLYNWYNTLTKEPLYPKYISTVDSGNFVGYLWLLSETLEEYLNEPVLGKKILFGISDTLRLCNEDIEKELGIKDFYSLTINKIITSEEDIKSLQILFLELKALSLKINDTKPLYWNDKVDEYIEKYLKEINYLFPWVDLFDNMPKELQDELKFIPSNKPLSELTTYYDQLLNRLEKFNLEKNLLESLKSSFKESSERIISLKEKINKLVKELYRKVKETDFKLLYDKKRELFSIGYDAESDTLNNCYYDLMASEARATSFIAIAKGDVDQKHWFNLGRSLTLVGTRKGLVSWTGTMFEYLMPLLIMKNFPDTLLNETYKTVVEGQKHYAKKKNVPWGISESAFYTFDAALNYQYKAFGIPGLGLKRGLAKDLVVSPYSTIMALMVDLHSSLKNLRLLEKVGLLGKYGFYDAVDYTKERLPKGKNKAIVKCYMVHHAGMSFMALDNVLNDSILQKRFHNLPKIKASELLLQEKVPKNIVYDAEHNFEASTVNMEKQKLIVRKFNTALTNSPETELISNGTYSLMITNSGGGYSKREDMMLYRWRQDFTKDNYGMFFYIKNINSLEYWSSAYEPVRDPGDEYEVTFSLDKAEFKRKDGNISTVTEITVSNEDNAEIRKLSITNHSNSYRTIEVTSYLEVTLSSYGADIVHPAFNNLFITTEFVENPLCVIANRRPRSKNGASPYLMQTIAINGEPIGNIQFETSRANFIGRGRDLSNPEVMENDTPLKNTSGAVLDPIISMRVRVNIPPQKTCNISYTTGVCDSKEEALNLALKYKDPGNINRVFELAWSKTQIELKYLGIKSSQANLYQFMASKILFLNSSIKEREKFVKNIAKSQSALWAYGISGDLPIVLTFVRKDKDIDTVRQLITAHEYLSLKGLKVDLVIINGQNGGYLQPLQNSLRELLESSHARDKQNKPGGIFLLNTSSIAEQDIELLKGIARIVVDADKGPLLSQIKHEDNSEKEQPQLITKQDISYDVEMENHKPSNEYNNFDKIASELQFFNEYGGFDVKNNEYVIILKDSLNTPAPWINVISNENFGFHVSESGISYSWCKNSRENKITAWTNDPIMDGEAEALFVRDEVNGEVWSISPQPIRDDDKYLIKHGFGYSTFVKYKAGILGEFTMFVPMKDKVKLCLVKLKNLTDKERNLSVSYYGRLTMGVVPENTSQYISTYIKNNKQYMYAKNPYSGVFSNLHAYLSCIGGENLTFTGDRTEFIGRLQSIKNPEGLKIAALSNTAGSGLDPCLAVNAKINLKPQEERYVTILLGEEENLEDIDKVLNKYNSQDSVVKELENTKNYWKDLLSTIQVDTPDKAMNTLLNGWLVYQALSCRIWARTAFYQSGGAYGFRDQLQDVMSFSYIEPSLTKNQILYSASRQFIEGDVQHWWHPIVDSGIRTRFSDDLLWLPFVTAYYINITGDYSLLDEDAYYLEDSPLSEGEDERYTISKKSEAKGSIYEHCIKAIEKGLKFGEHNIPLMGSGDWNDGMSTVGNKGKGESVWLGWFLYNILTNFIPICELKNDKEKVTKYTEVLEYLKENLELNAWDGSWYRRAYFDDGTPLGSAKNDECQIDSLSQSWSVISGAAKESRAKEAMDALEKYLLRQDSGIVLLLTPAFNKSSLEPGYIKGYIPGVRENGGQYTHAAVWVCIAFARMKEYKKAWKVFNMINPINHTKSYFNVQKYKVEPYVICADVYGVEPHTGRGGWTWYTGAAGWMYQAGINEILGLKFHKGEGFKIDPCIPPEWPGYKMTYKKDNSTYNIEVCRGEEKGIYLDETKLNSEIIPFQKEGQHTVKVII